METITYITTYTTNGALIQLPVLTLALQKLISLRQKKALKTDISAPDKKFTNGL
jgi:hypothetical protein